MVADLVRMTDGGHAMAYFGQEPWHGCGTRLDENSNKDIDAAMRAAGLDYDINVVPMQWIDEDGTVREVTSGRLSIRRDTREEMGCVGKVWTPFKNADGFRWCKSFLDEGYATIETAGALGKGERTWLLLRLEIKSGEVVAGDKVNPFLMLSNHHGGGGSVKVGFTPIRVVCSNTLATAHADGVSKLIGIRHGGQVVEAVFNLKEVMDTATKTFTATIAQYRKMAKTKVSTEDMRKYFRIVLELDAPDEAPANMDRAQKLNYTRQTNLLNRLFDIYDFGKAKDLPHAKGTVWGAYNTLNEWLNFDRGREVDTRLTSLWFGASEKTNAKALETALAMVV